jgi:hypothetical protein
MRLRGCSWIGRDADDLAAELVGKIPARSRPSPAHLHVDRGHCMWLRVCSCTLLAFLLADSKSTRDQWLQRIGVVRKDLIKKQALAVTVVVMVYAVHVSAHPANEWSWCAARCLPVTRPAATERVSAARACLQKRRNKVQPIATVVISIVIIVLEQRFRGDKLLFQQVSNDDATVAVLPAKS